MSGFWLGTTGLWFGSAGLWAGFTGTSAEGGLGGGGGDLFSGASLYLNMLSGPLDSRVTFTRGSNATMVDNTGKIVYAPANLNLQSEGFDTASWSKTLCTVTADALASPTGAVNADLVTDNSTSGTELTQAVTVTSGAIVAHSRYFKYGNNQWVRLILGDATNFVRGWFDIQNGAVGATTVGGTGGNASVTITNAGNGWYRCTLIGSLTGITSYGCSSMTAVANSNVTRVSGGTYYVWGAQLEQLTYQTVPGPYVTTTSAAYYGPRLEYNPVTLAPLGLLIEEQRTNLVLYSAAFNDATWTVEAGSVTANSAVSPDGTSTADLYVPDVTSSVLHRVRQSATTTAVAHTISVFAKGGGYSKLGIREGSVTGAYATFNLSGAGSVIEQGSGGTATVVAVGNGWYRATVSFTASVSARIDCYALPDSYSSGDPVGYLFSGDGVSGVLLWGAQIEAGAFVTSYIPTVASQVTRTADIATMTGTNFSTWYNASEGTFFSSFEASPNTFTTYVAASNGVVAQNSMHMDNDGAGNMRAAYYSGSSAVALLGLGAVGTLGAVNKMASAYKVNDFAASRNGGAVVTHTLGAVPVGVVQLNIGADPSGAAVNVSNTHIRQIAYFKDRLTNAQLQALTA